MTIDENPQHLRSAIPAVFCAEPINNGRDLCPHLLGACPDHPTCGVRHPIDTDTRCRRRDCDGGHAASGHDAWTSEAPHDEETPMPDPLTEHYAEVIRHVEALVTRRIPRLPFVGPPPALTDDEVSTVARGLAHAHTLAGVTR